jgi:rare lipoprotein A
LGLFTHRWRARGVARPLFLASLAVGAALPAASFAADDWHQDGQASYYGRHWFGHRTSSGAVFDPLKLTAAHASLPLGTRLLVTAENSGESVVVTVNDREPDHGHRIIDLSPAAARRLGMIGSGVAEVVVTRATAADISEQDNEVAEAPDEPSDLEVATPRHVSHARHGRPHTHHARR